MFDYISLLKNRIQNCFHKKFEKVFFDENCFILNEKNITVEVPKDRSNGHLSTNICMVFASSFKMSPKKIAEEFLKVLNDEFSKEFERIEIAGAGFINFFLQKEFLITILKNISNEGKSYGKLQIGSGKKINLEFCSANPTGPVHLGHIRGAIWGMVIANTLRFCDFDVDCEYYINDGGGQIETLLKSSFLRYLEIFGREIQIPKGFYPGEYLIDVGKSLKDRFADELLIFEEEFLKNGNALAPVLFEKIRRPVLDQILFMIKTDLSSLGVEFDIFSSETDLMSENHGALLNEMLEILKKQDLLYWGVLEKPKSIEEGESTEWEEREQLLFKSTNFGDDCDRAMQRSNGEWTYFAKDCAYHLHKLKRQYNRLILEVGVDHIGYKKRLSAAIAALANGLSMEIEFDFEFHNMVYIKKNDQQLKMSKRSGNLVGADFMKEAVGSDVLKFYLLSKKHDMELELDIDKAQEVSKDNPYFYIQYANTRASSILKNFHESHGGLAKEFENFDLLSLLGNEEFDISESEIEILIHLILWPKLIGGVISKLEPHRINFYLTDLAKLIHSWWNDGIQCDDARIISPKNKSKTFFRIVLIKVLLSIIASGLGLMKIKPIEKM